MYKRIVSLVLVMFLFAFSAFSAFASDGFGGNNTTVEDHLDENVDFLESSVYSITGGYIFNVAPGTIVENFKKNFTNPNNVSVRNANNDDIVTTGMTVEYAGTMVDSCIVVISGDVDCNGIVSVTDIVNATTEVLNPGTISTGTAAFKAADLYKSDSITVVDISKIRNIVLNK